MKSLKLRISTRIRKSRINNSKQNEEKGYSNLSYKLYAEKKKKACNIELMFLLKW
jgi:hypothetical protein